MREKLIELLWAAGRAAMNSEQNKPEVMADHLLANGVIVLPCNVGDTVYTRYGYSFNIEKIEILKDKKIIFRCGNDGTDDYMAFYDFEIGEEVFLTREEAEVALKEGQE